ncbi:MAG: hypothetical protein Q8S11_14250 [Daejeonella sp.]|uniref:hypothetical protein n=1 Tax=Daejeonella sp. TaxID=2805397 RepID=UPI0027339A3A|nr:hypothetical protein [Daejeonella sp.]MDP3469498.1 hypothetical protein [Daejeonella sp.]
MAKSNHLSWLLLLTFICIHFDIDSYSIKESLYPEIILPAGQARIQNNLGQGLGGYSLNKIFKEDHSDIIARVKQVYDSQIGVRESGLNRGPEVEKYLHYVNLTKGNPWCAAFVCWVFGKAGVANPQTGWSPSLFTASRVIWSRESGTKNQEPRRPPSVLETDSAYPTRQITGNNWLRAESGKIKAESPVSEQRAWSKEQGHVPYTYPTRQTTGNRQQITPTTGDVFGIYFPEKKRIAHVGFIDSWDGTWLITVEGNTNTSGHPEGDGVYRKRRPVRSIYRVARYINY